MSKSKPVKKVVVTTSKPDPTPAQSSRSRTSTSAYVGQAMIFGKSNFLFMIAGVVLIIIGLALMSGGAMPSPDVWDESIIYGARRTVIAPIFILAGLVVEVYAIFKK
jgi:hypothetical protein